MTKIAIDQFFGEATGVTPRLIKTGYAEYARDVDVRKRTLRGIRDEGTSAIDVGVGNPGTIFRYTGSLWLAWSDDVDVVRSPIIDDAFDRIYWTGDGVPKMAASDSATAGSPPYPNASFTLGVPAPQFAPSVAGSGGEEPDTAITTSYVYTYVTAYGEEGPPSPPSALATRWDDGGYVDLTIPPVNAPGRDIDIVRIYRSEFGGVFQYVDEVPAATASYRDEVRSEQLLTPLESTNWDPPNGSMTGLMRGPANSLAGFFGNKVCFSESNYPHAWPIGYRLTLEDSIVGMAQSAAGIVVATTGRPYLIVGASPESMAAVQIENDQAGTSKLSMVDMGDYVMYASPDGLVAVGQGSQLVTKELLEREAWQALNPYTIKAFREGDRYLAFYEGNGGGTFAFSPNRGFEFFTGSAETAYYDRFSDILYFAQPDGSLSTFDRGTRRTYTWRSGIFEVPPGTTFSCGKVIAAEYPVTIRLKSPTHGLQVEQVISNHQMFRLPPSPYGPSIREWQIEIESDKEVFSIQIAQAPAELV